MGLIEDPVVAKAALANFYSLKFRREGERLQAITDMLDTEWYKIKKNTSGRTTCSRCTLRANWCRSWTDRASS